MKHLRFSFLCPYLTMLVTALLIASCNPASTRSPSSEPVQSISFLDSVFIDGEPGDWPDSSGSFRIYSDVQGIVPDTSDLSVRMHTAWSSEGLLILAEITDDSIYEDPVNFWKGDGMEIFISPAKGSSDIVQYSVRPSFDLRDSEVAVNYYDYRVSDSLLAVRPSALFRSSRLPTGYRLEGRIPLDVIGLPHPEPGMEIALQLYINDSDRKGDSTNFSLPWYPVRDSYSNPYAFFRVRLDHRGNPGKTPEVRAYIADNKLFIIKVLSEYEFPGNNFRLVADRASRKFNLLTREQGLYYKTLEFPFKPSGSTFRTLKLFRDNQLLFSIDPFVLHRVYENVPSPNPYEGEIRIYEIKDHFKPPPKHAVLFTGSSSIRRWTDIERYFPGVTLLNRGFGGSTMKDLNYYAGRIVFPYLPSRIFVYEGDNDIAGGTSPEEFIRDCSKFIETCRNNVPEAEIIFLSIKPSLARIRDWKDMQAANLLLDRLTASYDHVSFIDISRGMLDADGQPRKDIFVEDGLHLNAEGYQILSKAISAAVYK